MTTHAVYIYIYIWNNLIQIDLVYLISNKGEGVLIFVQVDVTGEVIQLKV